jgi:hypothetical protein
VPYLPIDPADVGRQYEPVVRINSQSGKGGVAFVMNTVYGYKLPKAMHREFADVIQLISETEGGEVAPARIMDAFREEYLKRKAPYEFISAKVEDDHSDEETRVTLSFRYHDREIISEGRGTGPIDAVRIAIEEKRISTSLLQRKLEIGYSRAAKLIDRMQSEGYVSPPDGSKPRTILITAEEYMEKFIDNPQGGGEEA